MSDDNEEMVQVTHNVPKENRDLAQRKNEHGHMSEQVRSLYSREAHPDNVTDRDDINNRLRELRAERDETRVELRRVTAELETELESLETKIARLEERKDDAISKTDQFQGALDQLATHVEDGGHIWPEYPGVESAADTIGESPEFVIEQVREEVSDVPDERFEEGDIYGGRR